MSRRTPHVKPSRRPHRRSREQTYSFRPARPARPLRQAVREAVRQGAGTAHAARTALAARRPGPHPSRLTGRRGRHLSLGRIALAALALLTASAVVALLLRRRTVVARSNAAGALDRRGLDSLTGLPNRAEGVWWLNTRLARAQARGHRLALMILDLDGFAEVNAIYGRAVGDHVLQVTAARMQAQLRTGDMVCRAGNDTFMVIMDSVGPDHLVAQVGARVVAAVGEPITYHSEGLQVAASMGFAVSQDRDRNADLLLDRADRALIQAKSSARSIVQF